jgi:tRNA/tmRNA/rRNA uracil-C5-methylase (TrmA/RlmC/RlmD family)
MTDTRVQVGQRCHVSVDGLTPSGEGLATLEEGPRLTVPGVFPGETALVRIEHLSRQHPRGHARLVELERSLPQRREPPCAQHARAAGRCTGCPLMEVSESGQRDLKRTALKRDYDLEVDEIVAGEGLGYRASSKRVVGIRRRQLVLGSFVRGSHRLADMAGCLVDHPRIVECFAELTAAARELGIVPFDESSGEGDLRYVLAKTNGTEVLLTLVTANEVSQAAQALPERLTLPAGIAHSVQGAKSNVVRGDAARTLRGQAQIEATLGETKLALDPLGFLQPNPTLAARAYTDLICDPTGEPVRGSLALDTYAGAGTITRLLAKNFDVVRACDVDAREEDGLVERVDVDAFLRAQFEANAKPDLVICNPPRAGLRAAVCEALLALAPPRLAIMSCSPPTLRADLDRLAGGYRVERLRAYDTLPQTAWIELVAWLHKDP